MVVVAERAGAPRAESLAAVVLAAGEGSRMKSERPKPLHRLCGKPMLMYVLDSLALCGADHAVVVVGHKGDWVTKSIGEQSPPVPVSFVEQRVQRGTGDAAMIGLTGLGDEPEDGDVIILPGDAPLLRSDTIAALVEGHRSTGVAATVLTAVVDDPTGYGRIVRGRDGRVTRIVEQRDATPEELEIHEINTSIYVVKRSLLAPALRRLSPNNAQGEYYLTDVVAVLARSLQLAVAEAELRARTNESLLRSGVTMLDPANTYVDTTVIVGRDVTLFPGTILQGDTVIGDGCEIGPNAQLVDCAIGERTRVVASTGRRARVGSDADVGPYAHLAPGTEVPDGQVTGPFYTSVAADR